MEKDIVIQEDNYTGNINDRYKQIGQEIDDVVTEYVRILTDLTNGCIEGETAGKLLDFAEETARLLGNMAKPAIAECAGEQVNFISEVEIEDQ